MNRWITDHMRLCTATMDAMIVINRLAATAWLDVLFQSRKECMGEMERDSGVTINVGFGNITFCKDESGTYAQAVVEIDMGEPSAPRGDKIEISMQIASSPEVDTIADIVERSRTHLVSLLETAARHFEARTATELLYPDNP